MASEWWLGNSDLTFRRRSVYHFVSEYDDPKGICSGHRKGMIRMWFISVRLLFSGLIFIASIAFLRKKDKSHRKPIYIALLIFVVIIYIGSGFVPIENLFVTFSTPESAFHYEYAAKINMVVDGKVTTMIISSTKDGTSQTVIPKSGNGWKLDIGIDQKKVVEKIVGTKTIFVYRYKDSEDYYVVVWDPLAAKNNILNVSDNRNSKFIHYSTDISGSKYITYVNKFRSSGYELSINNQIVKFN